MQVKRSRNRLLLLKRCKYCCLICKLNDEQGLCSNTLLTAIINTTQKLTPWFLVLAKIKDGPDQRGHLFLTKFLLVSFQYHCYAFIMGNDVAFKAFLSVMVISFKLFSRRIISFYYSLRITYNQIGDTLFGICGFRYNDRRVLLIFKANINFERL